LPARIEEIKRTARRASPPRGIHAAEIREIDLTSIDLTSIDHASRCAKLREIPRPAGARGENKGRERERDPLCVIFASDFALPAPLPPPPPPPPNERASARCIIARCIIDCKIARIAVRCRERYAFLSPPPSPPLPRHFFFFACINMITYVSTYVDTRARARARAFLSSKKERKRARWREMRTAKIEREEKEGEGETTHIVRGAPEHSFSRGCPFIFRSRAQRRRSTSLQEQHAHATSRLAYHQRRR